MGSTKIRFRVCFASGEEVDYPAAELNTHSPHTRGWQSPQFCDYPQELGLELAVAANLTQVQILSHQSKIATRIELFVGDGETYEDARFQRLGYLSLNSNERSRFQARELKSVYIDGAGRFLRLLVHKCYVNELNLFNQVGIIAVNLLGGPLPPMAAHSLSAAVAATATAPSQLPPAVPDRSSSTHRGNAVPLSAYAAGAAGGGLPAEGLSAPPGVRRRRNEMDDLSFDMNFDPETAHRIRDIAAAKERAVASEDYDAAKRLKQAEVALKGLGTRLSQLEIAKRDAVDEEDYDRAKELKGEIEALRGQIDAQVAAGEAQGLLRVAGPSSNGTAGDGASHQRQAGGYAFGGSEPAAAGGGNNGGGNSVTSTARSVTPHDEVPVGARQRDGGLANISGTGGGPGGEYGGYGSDGTGGMTPPGDWGGGSGGGGGGGRGGGSAMGSPSPGRGGGGEDRPSERASPAARGTADNDAASLSSRRARASAADAFPLGQHPLEGVPGLEDLPEPEPISARIDLSEVQGLNALLGDYVARCLYSKTWSLREAAILKVMKRLPELAGEAGLEAPLPVLSQVLRLGAEDKIAQVFLTAVALLHDVLDAAAADRGLRHNVLVTQLEPVVATLLLKLGDGQQRVRDGAMDGLLAVARCKSAGAGFVGHLAAKTLPRKQATAWRPVQARLLLLAALVRDFGASGGGSSAASGGGASVGSSGSGGGLSADGVMSFAKNCDAFAHSNAAVRDAAKELAVAVYKAVGDDVERHLTSLRPKQLDEYRQAFREAGGPPPIGNGSGGGGGGGSSSSKRKSADAPPAANAGRGRGGGSSGGRGGGGGGGGGPMSAREREHEGAALPSSRRPEQARSDAAAAEPGRGGTAGGSGKSRVARTPSPKRAASSTPTRQNGGGGGAAAAPGGRRDDSGDEAEAARFGAADEGEEDDDLGATELTCQFCGTYNPDFTEDVLDLHYWQECPMLMGCDRCSQVVEVAALDEHRLDDCPKHDLFRECPVSGMAVLRTEFAAWQNSKHCRPPGKAGPGSRCPLCYKDVAAPTDEQGWKAHLIEACPRNPRRR